MNDETLLTKKYKELKDIIDDTMIDSIISSHTLGRDYFNVELKDSILNWTSFLTIRFSKNKNFDISHGSGGWNDGVSSLEKMRSIEIMFQIARSLNDIEDELFDTLREINKLEFDISNKKRIEEEEIKIKKLSEFKKEIEKDYKIACFDDVFKRVKEDKERVEVITINEYNYSKKEVIKKHLFIEDLGRKNSRFFLEGIATPKKVIKKGFDNKMYYILK